MRVFASKPSHIVEQEIRTRPVLVEFKAAPQNLVRLADEGTRASFLDYAGLCRLRT